MMLRNSFLLLMFTGVVFAFAPSHDILTVRGTITDSDGEPLIGTNILLRGTTTGTLSDVEGNYSLQFPRSSVNETFFIDYSYTGFEPHAHSLTLTPDQQLYTHDVTLQDGVALDEVVITVGKVPLVKRVYGAAVSAVESTISGRRSKRHDSPPPAAVTEYPTDADVPRSEEGKSRSTKHRSTAAGQLTAGEVNDFSKWELWNDIAAEDLAQFRAYWKFAPTDRFSVQLKASDGSALPDVRIDLFAGEKRCWTARTDNTGKAELWRSLQADSTAGGNYRIVAYYENKTYELADAQPFVQGPNYLTIPVDRPCDFPMQLDVAFVVDATGSMGDEIQYLQSELTDVIERSKQQNRKLSVRLGSVFYRDHGDEYLTRISPMSSDIKATTNFIQKQQANGGGDGPEAVEEALEVALYQLEWREEAIGRLLFLVLDAPPHGTDPIRQKLRLLTERAAALGVRIIPVVGSGSGKRTEYLMRSLALGTNGTYVFLTNHSGIGGHHIEPSTDTYTVEKLNDLLVRLIRQYSQLPNCKGTQQTLLNDLKPMETDPPSDVSPALVRCFPNPTSGPVQVELSVAQNVVYITDANGKLLFRRTDLEAGIHPFNLSNYPSGLYYVKTDTESLKVAILYP